MTQSFEDLGHQDHRVRLAAVERAGRQLADDRPRLMSVLAPALMDMYPGVRVEAALVLGDIAAADDAVLDWLVTLAADAEGDPGALRRQAALLGLGRAGLTGSGLTRARWEGAKSAALSAASEGEADVRFQAMTALTRLAASGPEVIEVARARIEDEDAEIVGVAAELLAALGDTASTEALRARMPRLPGEARRTVLFALAQLGAGGLVEALLAETDKLPYALRACELLGHLEDRSAVEPLAVLMGRWLTHRFIKVAAAAALVRLGDGRGEAALGRYLKARRKDMRGYAMEQIGALGLAAYREALIEVLKDSSDYHSDTAALALGQLGGEAAVAALEAALADPREEVREEAQRALGRPGAS